MVRKQHVYMKLAKKHKSQLRRMMRSGYTKDALVSFIDDLYAEPISYGGTLKVVENIIWDTNGDMYVSLSEDDKETVNEWEARMKVEREKNNES